MKEVPAMKVYHKKNQPGLYERACTNGKILIKKINLNG